MSMRSYFHSQLQIM